MMYVTKTLAALCLASYVSVCAASCHVGIEQYVATTTCPKSDSETKPCPEKVLEEVFLGKTLTDYCISDKVMKRWKVSSSVMDIHKDNSFTHTFEYENGTTAWVIKGSVYPDDENNRLHWFGKGRIPNGPQTTEFEGFMYILYYGPSSGTKTVVAYYSCWKSEDYPVSNVYIAAHGKQTDEIDKAKKKVDDLMEKYLKYKCY